MRYSPLILLLVLTMLSPAAATEQFPLKAGAGREIPSPIDPTTVEVRDGSQTIQLPAGMVFIPAGPFTFGRDEKRDLPAFCIGRFEVTNAEYKMFLEETGSRATPRYWKQGNYPADKANHPVLFVSLDHAEEYCEWVSKKTGWKVVIPSAVQWEKAARGPHGYLYPWGNEKDSHFQDGVLEARFNYNAVCAAHLLSKEAKAMTEYSSKSSRAGEKCSLDAITGSRGQLFSVTEDGNVHGWIDHSTNTGFVNTQYYRDLVDNGGFTTAVGSFPKGVSHYGCHDMAGNAYEWTSNVIIATNGAEKGKQVNDVRGGSWYSTSRSGMSLCTGEGRLRRGGYHSVGFRVSLDITPK